MKNNVPKEWTGERLENHIFNISTLEHLHRYAFAIEFCHNKTVLDIASGDGYGSNLLADVASEVIGVDISDEAIENAQNNYYKGNLKFIRGSATCIPVQDETFDVVISFETIEHHDQHEEMMVEIKRVLKNDGIFIISTPDKKYYSDLPGYKNPYHIKELHLEDFKNLLNPYYFYIDLYAQKAGFMSVLMSINKSIDDFSAYKGNFDSITRDLNWGPMYWVAVCSNLQSNSIKTRPFFNGDNIYSSIIIESNNSIRASYTYRIGNIMLKPIKLLRKFIGI